MSITYNIDSVLRDRQAWPDPLNYDLDAKQTESWSEAVKETKAVPSDRRKNPIDFASTVQVLNVFLPYPKPELFGVLITTESIDGASNLVFPDPPGVDDNDRVWTSSSFGVPYGVQPDVPFYVVNAVGNQFQISTTLGGLAIPLTPATVLELRMVIFTPETQEKYEESKVLLTSPVLYMGLKCIGLEDDGNIRCINGVHRIPTHLLFRGGVTPDPFGAPGFLEFYSKSEQTQRWYLNKPLRIMFETRGSAGAFGFAGNQQPLTIFKETQTDLENEVDRYRQSIIDFIVTPFIRDATYSNHFLEPQADL